MKRKHIKGGTKSGVLFLYLFNILYLRRIGCLTYFQINHEDESIEEKGLKGMK